MRRRGVPIAWIGVIFVSIAFVVWYGWQTNVAPYLEQQRQETQQKVLQPTQPPSEAEIKAQLEQNRQALAKGSKQSKSSERKPQTPPQLPKPDPRREVMEYWWEQAPPKTKK
ncbi:MAG: hypothetical protein NZ550_02415 [Fimbriimonadales bacterium]|nr:hypothetical protein [Fimbriimonadales bacterium]MDW8051807.1 hypothetical protein [Armatimonadota bacterium]